VKQPESRPLRPRNDQHNRVIGIVILTKPAVDFDGRLFYVP
jgi:hypothetical protein